ncbi:DUF3976 domain-containing protein [Gracilibacillus massiliensis]|uniref:DUF3976 domain-containing protein n=1 Tax=Gracilibacillus massiliensis TaxID=1564956 RepID=UPI00071C3067|nr:DUF3976 domain-containing protein [Gracilibacillus massiliensis]
MTSYFWVILVVVGAIISFFISKKNRDKHNALTRKGFYQLITLFVLTFVATIIIVVWTNN